MIKKLETGEEVPFTRHLEELRKRLIVCAITVGAAFTAMWAVSELLLMPFAGLISEHKMVFINPTEAFFVHLKVAFYAALGLSVPVLIYQGWAFVSPGLLKQERKFTIPFVVASTLFFAGGAAFCFFIVLPFGLSFLISYGGTTLTPMLSISSFLGFCFTLMFVFGVVFQLPLIVVFLNLVGVVDAKQLANFRPFLIVSSFVISAIITPPDVFTQVVLALPLIILYEASIIVVKIFGKSKKGEAVEEDNFQTPTDSSS